VLHQKLITNLPTEIGALDALLLVLVVDVVALALGADIAALVGWLRKRDLD
jgi:hypothetical protein